jgi:hypothetical protein
MKPKNTKLPDYSIYFEHYKKLILGKQIVFVQDEMLRKKLIQYFFDELMYIQITLNGSGAFLKLIK